MDGFEGEFGDASGREAGVDDDPAGGGGASLEQIALAHAAVEVEVFEAGADGFGFAVFAGEAGLGGDVEVDHKVWFEATGGGGVGGADDDRIEPPSMDLVGESAGSEAVADDGLAAFEGGMDDGGDELSAGGEKCEEFSPGSEGLVKEAADEFAGGGAAGFAGVENLEALGLEAMDDGERRRALARAFAAFEDDETSAVSAQGRRRAPGAGF